MPWRVVPSALPGASPSPASRNERLASCGGWTGLRRADGAHVELPLHCLGAPTANLLLDALSQPARDAFHLHELLDARRCDGAGRAEAPDHRLLAHRADARDITPHRPERSCAA